MKTGILFHKIWQCTKKIVVCQGGGDSGKTVSILQNIGLRLTQKKLTATVTGVDLPNLKGGVMRAFVNYVLPDLEPWIRLFNKAENTYYFINGSILEFKSFENEQDARGSERDILFINEANGVSYSMFWQLQRKTRGQVFLDYNPTSQFWVHDKLIGGYGGGIMEMQFYGKVQMFITDHRHNIFLTKEDHEMYESISDPDFFAVYSRGKTGKIRGLIFGHFKKVEAIPEKPIEIIWGLDFGYTSDPTALVKIAKELPRKRTGKECCYEAGLSAEEIKAKLDLNGYIQDQLIYAEADPNMINQLRVLGLPVMQAIKGPGSVAAGIAKVREHECYYTADSENFEKEIQTYKFMSAQDIITGKEVTTNVPVKGWDHCCDAFRYADYTDSFRQI